MPIFNPSNQIPATPLFCTCVKIVGIAITIFEPTLFSMLLPFSSLLLLPRAHASCLLWLSSLLKMPPQYSFVAWLNHTSFTLFESVSFHFLDPYLQRFSAPLELSPNILPMVSCQTFALQIFCTVGVSL
jgi:hypothetical protein